MSSGILYLVSTPIGNLEDLSPRAQRLLGEVACIAAEDTRHSAKLLQHFGIRNELQSLHDHNEAQAAPALIERLLGGQSIALISDAGTPLVSDPGFKLVQAARDAGITVQAIPGASAALAALCVSGLPSDRF
ncbi:MAG: 16S rRNA (cytidine(1402)-2'-O)-methyltransferase, partial [Nevskiales bacterium]